MNLSNKSSMASLPLLLSALSLRYNWVCLKPICKISAEKMNTNENKELITEITIVESTQASGMIDVIGSPNISVLTLMKQLRRL